MEELKRAFVQAMPMLFPDRQFNDAEMLVALSIFMAGWCEHLLSIPFLAPPQSIIELTATLRDGLFKFDDSWRWWLDTVTE